MLTAGAVGNTRGMHIERTNFALGIIPSGELEIAMLIKGLFLAIAMFTLWGTPAFAQPYRDPIAYCQAVGTINPPDTRYVGPKLPRWMARTLNLEPDQGSMMEWRCADGAVLACVYGANIPCDAKADTSQTPTQAITDYCRLNKNASYIPMVVTGHETAIKWACQGKKPVVIGVVPTDAQGYNSTYWQKVQP
jgi:hypothetical protein